jgi:ABC-2 type transport system permease protein
MVNAYNKGTNITGEIVMFVLSMFIVQLIFLSLGMALAALIRNSKSSGSLSTGTLLGAFGIAKITDMTDKLNILNMLSPFKYFNYGNIVNGIGISTGIVILSVLLSALLLVSTYLFYQRRDLSV